MVLVMTTIMMKIILTNLAGCSSLPTPGSWLVHTEQFLERLNTTCLAISTNFYASILFRVKFCTRIGPAATADNVWQFPQTYFDKYSFCWVLDLLILPVLESVDEGVDCGRHPGEHAGNLINDICDQQLSWADLIKSTCKIQFCKYKYRSLSTWQWCGRRGRRPHRRRRWPASRAGSRPGRRWRWSASSLSAGGPISSVV